jgi:hypothetical protein
MTQNETSSIHLGRSDPQAIVDHYARLALLNGWIDHARHQVMMFEKDPSGLYIGLGKAVAQRIKELK